MAKESPFKINIDANIFNEMGLKDLPEEKKNQMLTNMISIIATRVSARILDLLEEDDQKTFEELIDKGDNSAIEKFLRKKIPNFEKIIAEESLLYKIQAISEIKSFLETAK